MTDSDKHLWDDAYPPLINWHYKGSDKPVHSIFEESAERFPDKPCIDFLGKRLSYGEIHQLMLKVATGLQKMGISKGDRVGLCLPNTPYYIACYYAISKIGATIVNFNPLYTEEEISQQIEDSQVHLMITVDVALIFDKVNNCLNKTPLSHIIYCSLPQALPFPKNFLFRLFKSKELAKIPDTSTHYTSFAMLTRHDANPIPVEIDAYEDTAVFQYTGGTTGIPKAALLTHSNVCSNAEQVTAWLSYSGSRYHDKYLAVLPFFHVFAMTAVMNMAIKTASEIIMLPRFDLKQVLQTISKKKPTIFPAVPTIFNAINNHKKLHKYNLLSIDYCISGGATLPLKVKQQFETATGCTLVEGYGLSEASPVTHCNPPHTGGKVGAIGIPLPGTDVQIRKLDNIDKIADIDERGELVVKGPQIMKGYHNRDEENKEIFTADGFLRTGDVGYLDNDGYVFLTDRLKEIIISNGYNIYPRIIEEALYKHEDVDEVIVIAVRDTEKGEAPKAFVKVKDGASVTEEELLTFAHKHLNPLEKPRELEIRSELPKTLIGKLSKKELIQEEAIKEKKSS